VDLDEANHDLLEHTEMNIQKFVEETNDRNVEGWRQWDMHHFVLGLCGETGELANNAKKHSRWLVGWKGKAMDVVEFIDTLKEELPDIMIYLCLIAGKYDLDLGELVKDKVEVIKERFGWK